MQIITKQKAYNWPEYIPLNFRASYSGLPTEKKKNIVCTSTNETRGNRIWCILILLFYPFNITLIKSHAKSNRSNNLQLVDKKLDFV